MTDGANIGVDEHWYRRLFDANPQPMWVYDVETLRFLAVNDAAVATYGYSRPEFLAMTIADIRPSEDVPRLLRSLDGPHEAYDRAGLWRHRKKDGTVIDVEITSHGLDFAGRPAEIVLAQDVTERRRAEAAARESAERLRLAVVAGRVGLWDHDPRSGRVVCSPEWRAQLGLPPDEVGDATLDEWTSRLHPDDRSAVLALVQNSLADPTVAYEAEFRLRHRDGGWRWFHSRGQVFRDASGAAVRMLGCNFDVTERKRAEIQLEHLSRVYRLASEIHQLLLRGLAPAELFITACTVAVQTGGFRQAWVATHDPRTRQLTVVAHAGGTPETLQAVRAFVEGPDAKCLPTLRAIETGRIVLCNDIEHDPDTIEWRQAALERGFRSMVSLPLAGDGRPVATFNLYAGETDFFDEAELRLLESLAADISFGLEVHERDVRGREAEAALRASEERFRELAETIEDVFWIIDPASQRLLYVSPAYETLSGRPRAGLEESVRAWVDGVHNDDRARVSQALVRLGEVGEYEEEYRIVRPDGQVRWVRDRAFPVRDAEGRLERIVGVARDVTDRRAAEEQLLQAQKMESIGRLAGGVAHDFNNILSAVLMQAELIGVSEELSDEARRGINDIQAAAERGAGLTRQLLLFSRRQTIQPTDLDLNEVVTALARMLRRIVGEDVHVRLDLGEGPLVARADPSMVDQLLLNLAVNARDAMPSGGDLVIATGVQTVDEAFARQHPEAMPGRYAWLSVSDTGTGIPLEVMPHIFEPFFTTKEAGRGTGLGLATVFGIVQTHHGWIETRSTVDEGTTFRVFLPLASTPRRAEAADGGPAPRGGDETILLAEDEPLVRALVRSMLERAGYEVVQAGNGSEALAEWARHRDRVRLLLTDLVMPAGMSGQQLARRLQEDRPDLPVVFMSGYSAEIAGQALALGTGETFLQKPFTHHQLLAVVRRSLDASAAADD